MAFIINVETNDLVFCFVFFFFQPVSLSLVSQFFVRRRGIGIQIQAKMNFLVDTKDVRLQLIVRFSGNMERMRIFQIHSVLLLNSLIQFDTIEIIDHGSG